MKPAKTSITLLIPDLLNGLTTAQIRQQTGLTRLLDRADVCSMGISGFERSLVAAVFGEYRDLSLAWLSRLGERDKPPAQGAWLRVDPVHMAADRDKVLMLGNDGLDIDQHEADRLIDELNTHYREQDWLFSAPDPKRWYLHLSVSPGLHCSPLSEVVGKSVHESLPSGQNGLLWHRVINEIQMLLYQSQVNQARRETGRLEINSIWIWGDGNMQVPVQTQWSRLSGDDELVRGLALATGTDYRPLPDQAVSWLAEQPGGKHLLVLTGLTAGVATDRFEMLRQYERDWFEPLLAMLRRRDIEQVDFFPCDGNRYRVKRSMLLRFWRRHRRFGELDPS